MKASDPYEEWFQRNWGDLIATYFALKPGMVFGAFCDMKFMERREPLNPMLVPYGP